MPLSKRKQKELTSLVKEIVGDINKLIIADSSKAVEYIQLALNQPNQITNDDFSKKIDTLDSEAQEKLIELRNLYLNENPLFNDPDPEVMKTFLNQLALSEQEVVIKIKLPPTNDTESKIDAAVIGETPLQKIARVLELKPGDIIISEMAFQNPTAKDFENFKLFVPGHTSVWTGEKFDRPFAHSVREGYRPPGLKVSGIWEGRHIVFRLKNDPAVANQTSSMIRAWATAETLYTKEQYQSAYPHQFWDRQERDLKNYFGDSKASNTTIAGPATPYGGARAFFDIANLEKNKNLAKLDSEGLRRAIKFAALQNLEGASISKKGQRCTPVVVAAFQASILAPIVIAQNSKIPFKQFKDKPFLEYADEVLIPNWRDTALGKALLKAYKTNDYSEIFPEPFAVDQRYALPKNIFAQLTTSPAFEQVGSFSYFKDKILALEKHSPQVAANAPKKKF